MIPSIKIEDYNYDLPDERIAKYPLPERDSSKLLRYRDGHVDAHVFKDLPGLLPEGSMMVFNDTKVVPARLHFQRESGAHIEIFCLEPVAPAEYNLALASLNLRATLSSRDERTGIVEFSWDGGEPFSNILDICGSVPIPPYLNRETEAIDSERYQTLYAKIRGSVAAPTAGLHFTDRVLDGIRTKGIDIEDVCLHVGAGTFLPVKSSEISGHPMHREPFVVSLDLLKKIKDNHGKLIAVGTTSVRTLESLYYAGVSCIENGKPEDVGQWAPYEREYPYSTAQAIGAIIGYLEANGLNELKIGTRIIIVPGVKFRLVDILVTNFHQPESTLILLVSAFVGGDWRTIYDFALSNGFRFLSYGDSSLLFRRDTIANGTENT